MFYLGFVETVGTASSSLIRSFAKIATVRLYLLLLLSLVTCIHSHALATIDIDHSESSNVEKNMTFTKSETFTYSVLIPEEGNLTFTSESSQLLSMLLADTNGHVISDTEYVYPTQEVFYHLNQGEYKVLVSKLTKTTKALDFSLNSNFEAAIDNDSEGSSLSSPAEDSIVFEGTDNIDYSIVSKKGDTDVVEITIPERGGHLSATSNDNSSLQYNLYTEDKVLISKKRLKMVFPKIPKSSFLDFDLQGGKYFLVFSSHNIDPFTYNINFDFEIASSSLKETVTAKIFLYKPKGTSSANNIFQAFDKTKKGKSRKIELTGFYDGSNRIHLNNSGSSNTPISAVLELPAIEDSYLRVNYSSILKKPLRQKLGRCHTNTIDISYNNFLAGRQFSISKLVMKEVDNSVTKVFGNFYAFSYKENHKDCSAKRLKNKIADGRFVLQFSSLD